MAYTTDNVYEAIGRAAMMAERVGGRYIVVTFRGRWRVISNCPHVTKDRIVWRSWKTRRESMVVKDTELNREIVRNVDRSEAAEILGVSTWQLDYAAKLYGWETKKYGVQIDVECVRQAMKTMTAAAYAEQLGVYPTRIYDICKRYNIARPVRDLRGKPRANGPFKRKDAPTITKEMVEEGLTTMTTLEFAKAHNVSVSWVYVMCIKHGIKRGKK